MCRNSRKCYVDVNAGALYLSVKSYIKLSRKNSATKTVKEKTMFCVELWVSKWISKFERTLNRQGYYEILWRFEICSTTEQARGAVLFRRDKNNVNRPIAFISHTFSDREKR